MSLDVGASNPFWIDVPETASIEYPLEQIYGWIGVQNDGASPLWLSAPGGGGDVFPIARVQRPDLGARPHVGISFFIDLPRMLERGWKCDGNFALRVHQGSAVIGDAVLPVSDRALAPCNEIIANRASKAAFVRKHSKGQLTLLRGSNAPSGLPKNWPISPRIEDKTDAVSSHFYGVVIWDFLNSLSPDAMVLDAGAGFRRLPARNVINMEIYDYPSTDVLGIGQDLPFQDNTFDAVLSLAVLEHVDDPFVCARELVRVVKPSGKIFVIIPFLQAEHGYPSHYFNATRFGLRELFARGTELETHFLERANHPIFTCNEILGHYAAGLPTPIRQEFLEMKIGDLLSRSPDFYIDQRAPIVEAISEHTKWIIASGTTAIFRKQ